MQQELNQNMEKDIAQTKIKEAKKSINAISNYISRNVIGSHDDFRTQFSKVSNKVAVSLQ